VPKMTVSLARDQAVPDVEFDDAPVRVLRDQVLYRRGQPKTHIYLIEAGTIAVYQTRGDGTHNVVEFVFAGDTVGFGFLDKHIYSAQAIGETRVRCLPLTALDRILEWDKRATQRYAEAMQREFEYRRDELVSAERKPASRVAALFVALSRRNEEEGRNPQVIGDVLDCATVAEYLGLDLDTLGRTLVDFEHAHLIERCAPNSLRLSDRSALQQLANEVI